MTKHLIRYWLPVWIWAILIFTLSSFSSFPKPVEPLFSFDKLVHTLEYAIFAFLLARAFKNSKKENLKANFRMLAALIAVIYALSDELHQYFVPLRTPDFWDFVFDSLGAVLGQIFFKP